jgi:prophage regulatory protein
VSRSRRTGRLVALREIAERLGVSPSRARQLADRWDFPAPYDELHMGRVWLTTDVEAWIREHRPPVDEDTEGE